MPMLEFDMTAISDCMLKFLSRGLCPHKSAHWCAFVKDDNYLIFIPGNLHK